LRALFVAAISALIASCSPGSQFSEANRLLRAHVAEDVSLYIDEASETRHQHSDGTYTVCGRVTVNQPGVTTNARERFLINVHDGGGLGFFDGASDPAGMAEFQGSWLRLCGTNSANETFLSS